MAYTPTGNYNDQIVNPTDKAQISAFQDAYTKAQAKGDKAGMQAAHAGAEAIRANYGYSGGGDGSGYISNGKGNTVLPEIVAPKEVYTGTSGESYINQLQDARIASAKNAIQSAYDQSMVDLDAQEAKLPKAYDAARSDLSAQHELERMNYNEYAAGQNINTGASSQVRLSQNNAYLRNLADINAKQADAVSALQLERTKAKMQYQADIKQAILDGDTARAEALYQDFQRQDDNKVNAAMQLASWDMQAQQANLSRAQSQQQLDMTREDVAYQRQKEAATDLAEKAGDFSGFQKLYGWTDGQTKTANDFWAYINGYYPSSFSAGSSGSSGGSGGSGGRRRSSGGGNSNSDTASGNGTQVPKSGSSNDTKTKSEMAQRIQGFNRENTNAFLGGQISYAQMLQNQKDFAKAPKNNTPKNASTK